MSRPAAFAVSTLAAAAACASPAVAATTLLDDSRALDVTAYAADSTGKVEDADRIDAIPGQAFGDDIELLAVSPAGSTVVRAAASQTSAITLHHGDAFEITGELAAESATAFEAADDALYPDGHAYPMSVFDITLEATSEIRYTIEVHFETAGDATASFSGFGFAYDVLPLGGESQSFTQADTIEAGAFRLYADVIAPPDLLFDGTSGRLSFTITGHAIPTPTTAGAAAVCAALAAAAAARRGR